ncbi:MAG TPA: ADOP family duplicated permease [Vicinamibacterales bacterium]|nr:ADOP family duplicated permease [Vicinamibacterales bacterium]
MADLAADLRFAWRILARDRWFTAGAILTLALAMGVANTTFISTYAALWRDFPFERPDRIAIMRTVDARGREAGLSFADYQDWRRDARVFDGPSAAFAIGTISLGRDGAAPEQFDGLYVSADTFSVLRVKPQLGRDFSAADDRAGAEAVAIISSNIWKSRYAASRDVLGRKVTVNGAMPATIVGVMPDGVRFIDFTDIWLPLAQMPGLAAQRRDTRPLMMIGRLPDRAGLDRVRAGLSPIAANIAVAHPDTNKDVRPLVNTLLEAYNGGGEMKLTNSLFYMPLLAAAFILLIAAANLANLLLARAANRSREIAIRLAIGATQWRIVRGLLIESLLLASVAWVLAVGFSWLVLTISTSHAAPQLPYWRIKMDARLLVTLAAIALVTTGLFGLAPAVYASRRATADGLKEGGRLSTPPKVRRWTHALLVGQFAVTLALLNGAGLAARRFFSFYAVDRNVQTSDTVTTVIRLPAQTYATRDQRIAFHEQLKARLLSVPGVTASTVASAAPFSPAGRRQLTSVDGQPTTEPPPDVMTVVVEPAYFQTLVGGLVLGEPFSEPHGTPGHEAAIVNQQFASVYLGAGNPIGHRLEIRPPTARRTYLREADSPAPPVSVVIIGVAPDIRQIRDAVPMVYLPFRAEAPAAVTLIVRGSAGLGPVVPAVRDAVNAIDPDLALGVVRTLDELRDRSRAGPADMASHFATIGGLALVFSGVGLYSAMAYAVRRRTQEIAVRMALGAQAAQVRWLFLKTGAWVIMAGVIFGVPAALVVGRLLQNTFVRTEARDAVTLLVTVALLAIVALVASVIPTERATRLEPTTALRIE